MVSIFNIDYEPPLQIKRNRLTGPSSVEREFRPCIRIINNNIEKKSRVESLKPIKPDHEIKKPRPEKLHYFKYREDYVEQVRIKQKAVDNNERIKEEMRLMTKIGFTDKRLPSNFSLIKMQRNEDKKYMLTSAYWHKKENDRLNALREESEQIGRDKDYVKTLSEWDNKYLPKIK